MRFTRLALGHGVDMGRRWTSARIRTGPDHDTALRAGRITQILVRLRVGAGDANKGTWPVFWSLGTVYRGDYQKSQSIGEINILETVDGLPSAWHTVHYGPSSVGGLCNENGRHWKVGSH